MTDIARGGNTEVRIEAGRIEVRSASVPERPEGFALIRLITAGICNTDLELQRGYYGFAGVPGHEFTGEVVAADSRDLIGKRVVGEINLNCGNCSWCHRGLGRHCPSRTVLGIVRHPGAFREFLTLPERNLHIVPDGVPSEVAVFAEPIAAACEILEQVRIPCGTPVAVLGDGKLGLLIAQVLQVNGYHVHLFGHHRDKMRIAERAGVVGEIAGAHPPEAEYEWVVDATGSPAGLRTAAQMVQPRGTLILKSTVHGEAPVDTARLIVNELTVVGSRCGPFEPALELLRLRAIDVASMVSGTMRLEDAPRAFARAAEPGAMKILLTV